MSGKEAEDGVVVVPGRRLIVWLVAAAYFMELLDGTVIATALPQIARSFSVNAVDLNLGVSAYFLTLGVFIPVSGWVADRFGARWVFGFAITWFTLASILCGFSFGLWSFTAARVLQGIGGAMMIPVGRLVVLRTTAKKDLLKTTAFIIWPGLLAPVLGPAVGGFITTYFSWRWIFFLNVPLGLIGAALNFAFVPNLLKPAPRRLDLRGFLLASCCVGAVVYGAEALSERASKQTVALLAILGLSTGVLSFLHFRRARDPLLDFRAMRRHTFSVFVWGGSLFRITIATPPFLLPLMFQIAFGMTPFAAGLLVMAVFVGNIAIKPATTMILRAWGFRNVLIVNGLLVSATLAACGFLTPTDPPVIIAIILFIGGACRSLQFTALSTIQFAELTQDEISGANTLSSTAAQVTSGLGVAAGAVAVNLCVFARGGSLDAPQTGDFHKAFFLIAAASLLSILDYVGLAKDAGEQIAGRDRGEGTASSKR